MYNKDNIKKQLSLQDISLLLDEFGGEPQIHSNYIIAKTICHNGVGEGSHKLYYYNNTQLFHCYTGCAEPSFDIFELVLKILNQMSNKEYTLHDAILFVARYFRIEAEKNDVIQKKLEDWQIFQKYENNLQQEISQPFKLLKPYQNQILDHLPHPTILPWIEEGISQKVLEYNHIAFDPISCSIIIPHYNMDNELIGIRQRTLIKDDEVYGKYRPAYLNNQTYKHALGFNLYNLNNSKEHIKQFQTAIVFESEKSPLLYQTYFGIDNDISVAVCGFNLLHYQFQLLMQCNIKEIVIAFDKQFKETGDEEWKALIKKYTKLNEKYGSYVKLSFIYDNQNLLEYKDSPIDKGKDVFLQLFKERKVI